MAIHKILTLSLLIVLVVLIVALKPLKAQGAKMWNHKKCAVCLTYDDALNVHLDKVLPVLDSLGLKGTFYVPVSFPGFKNRLADWKALAEKGNELGNHTIFHPCAGSLPGRDWVQPDYDLDKYTMKRFIDEVEMANVMLTEVDGKTRRTFAYTCGDKIVQDSSCVPYIKKMFVAARDVNAVMQPIDEIDLFNIGSYMINGDSGDKLIALVKQAYDKQALLVFLFHGVGGEHSINVSLRAHNELLRYLKQNENDIWVAPLVEIAEYIKEYQHVNNQ